MDALDQIGDTVIESLGEYFSEAHNVRRIDRLVKQVKIRDAEKPRADSAVAGKTVVFTGTLEQMTRDEAKAFRRSGSAPKCPARWSKKTDYVVAGPGCGLQADGGARSLALRARIEDEWAKLIR